MIEATGIAGRKLRSVIDGGLRAMRGRRIGPILCKTGLLLTVLPGVAVGKSPLPTEDDFLAAVPKVSSAARLEKSLLEAGMSVTIIDREMIEASPAIEIPDLLRLVPGFQVAHATGSVFAPVYHGAGDQWPRRMEVMIDGRSVYLNTNSSVDWSALGLAIEDIERIEVVRGPNAPSFGSNAVTGSINIVTRAPFLLKGTHMRGTFGAQDTASGVARWGGSLGDWDTSVTAQYREDDGFDNVNDHKRLSHLRFRGDYQAGMNDSLMVQLGATYGEIGADAIGDYFNPIRDRDIRSHYQQLVWDRETLDGEHFRVNLYHNYYHHNDSYAPDIGGFPVPPGAEGFPGNYPLGTTLPLALYTATSERYDIEFQHTLSPRENWRLAWGFGGRHDHFYADLLLGERDEVERLSGRLFGSAEWSASDRLALHLDALTEFHEAYGSKTSPRLALNFRPTDTQSIRASASRSYRVFTLLERFIDNWMVASNGWTLWPLITSNLADDFTPERVTNYELGYSQSWKSLDLWLDVKLFREKLDRSGTAINQPGPVTLWRDDGGGWRTKGFEVQLDYRPLSGTRLLAAYSYAYTEGEVENEINLINGKWVSDYEEIDDTVPRHTFSTLLSHRFDSRWSGSLALYYMDDVRWRGEGSSLDEYTRLDLKLAHDFRLGSSRGQLALIVHNLTGEEYEEFRIPGDNQREGNEFDRRGYLQLSLEFD